MRVQVNLSDEMVEKTNYYSKKMGVTRSSLCTMLIGQGIMNFDNAADILKNVGSQVSDILLQEAKG